MATTFANSINSNLIYADRAEKDAAGNTISSTYATKSELPDGVPAVTSSDNNKVLKASYSGGVASYSWQPESGGGGGGGADWAAEQGEPGYISNKPTPKTLTAGTGVSISESPSTITVSCNVTAPVQDVTVDGTSVVSNGVAAITMPTPPTVDQTYSAASTNAQSGTAVADAIGNLPANLTAAQIQALKEALGVDETVLWTDTESDAGVSTFTLSELSTNFERLRFYGLSYGSTRVQYECPAPTSTTEAISISYYYLCSVTDNNPWQMRAANYTTQDGLTYSYGGMNKFAYGTTAGTAFAASPTDRKVPIYKIVGIHRIASN